MLTKKIFSTLAAVALTLAATVATPARVADKRAKEARAEAARVRTPLDLAVLVQDDLVARVGNELGATRDFIRCLPAGSRVMVGYLTSGSLQVRQPFTDDLERAANALRVPVASESASPYNPYVELIEALKKFDAQDKNRNAVLLISDGLDVSRGFDSSSSLNSVDLLRAVSEAKRRDVAIYTFYAPAVGLTSYNQTAVSYGQSSLARVARETGGEAFFQGTSFVTFDAYFAGLGRALNGTSTAY
jgi:predicted secreted protein